MRTLLLLVVAAFGAIFAASAGWCLEPFGDEFQVNGYTTGSQNEPAVAALANGGFVILWQDLARGIVAQLFAADGSATGGELQVDGVVSDYDARFSVAGQSDGGFVVAWRSIDGAGDNSGESARRFDADGSPSGDVLQVNTYTTSFQRGPDVAAAAGGFVVVWSSDTQDGNYDGVFGQRFEADGTPAGSEFAVNTYTTGGQGQPSVALHDDGRFVVVWNSYPQPFLEGPSQDGSLIGVFAQRFSAAGDPDGTEFRVNSYTTGSQYSADVAIAADGSFVVVWSGSKYAESSAGLEVSAQLFDEDGAPLGTEFVVNEYTGNFERKAHVGVAPDGDFLVVWQTGDGCASGDLTCKLQQGGFIRDVKARKVSADGVLGDEFLVNTFTPSDQENAVVAGLAGNGFIVAWESSQPFIGTGQDGDGDGVFAQLFSEPTCGDASADGAFSATDALITLRAAVGVGTCETCVCDVNHDGNVRASDALIVLENAVGQQVELACTPC